MQSQPTDTQHAPRSTLHAFTLHALRDHFDSLLLFVVSFSLYLFTLSPDLLPADSGEFQAVVPLLGVAHPPGFSLYILLGKAFVTLVRVGSYAYRLNLFSAFTSSLTLVLVNLAVCRLVTQYGIRDTQHSANIPQSAFRILHSVPGLLAAFTLGVSTTFWSQATTANIRSLMALLTALAVYALIEYRLNPTINRLAFLAFSLSLAIVHHLSIAFIAVVFAASTLLFSPPLLKALFLQGRGAGGGAKLAIALLAPFLVLLYLPIRGAQGAYLAPPGLDTLSGFFQHALGLGFGGDFFYFANFSALPDRLAILLNIFEFQFNTPLVIVLALGLILFFRRDWKLALALTLAFAAHCFVSITYRAPQTVEYLLPAYVILVVAAFAGLGHLAISGQPSAVGFTARQVSATILYCSLFIASLLVFVRNFPAYRALAFDRSTRNDAAGLLLSAPPDSIILANWHYATPLWYLQVIEGMRPDVDVEYVFPQGTSLAQNWVDRIVENADRRPTLVTDFYPQEYAALPYRFLPILTALPAWQAAAEPFIDPSSVATDDMQAHERGWTFLGGGASTLTTTANRVAQNDTFNVQIFWQAPATPSDINFFVQLIGPDGRLYGQGDAFHPASRIDPHEVLSDRFPITVNADAPISDGYSLVTGAYLPDGARLAPDFTELARLAVVPRSTPPATRHVRSAPSPLGLLAGYDYDLSLPDSPRLYLHWRLDGREHTFTVTDSNHESLQPVSLPAASGYLTTSHDLPPGWQEIILTELDRTDSFVIRRSSFDNSSRYVSFGPLTLVGATITRERDGSYRVDLDWLANEPITGDYIVKVDLVGENYAWRDQSDSVPAGGAIPTLKWIPGIVIHDRHRLTMLQSTTATFQLAVYDHFTQRNLPILDSRLALLGPTVPLGAVTP